MTKISLLGDVPIAYEYGKYNLTCDLDLAFKVNNIYGSNNPCPLLHHIERILVLALFNPKL